MSFNISKKNFSVQVKDIILSKKTSLSIQNIILSKKTSLSIQNIILRKKQICTRIYILTQTSYLSISSFSDDFEFFSVDGNGMVSYHFFEKPCYE